MGVVNSEVETVAPVAVGIAVRGVGFQTLGDLPDPACRWTPRRKATVAALIGAGLTSAEAMAEKYRMGIEELASWCSLYDRHGLGGLRTGRFQQYAGRRLRKMKYAAWDRK